MKNYLIKLLPLLLLIVFATSIITGAMAEDRVTLKVALNGEEAPDWEYVKEQLALEGIDLELVFFSDYIFPNTALADGDVDLNAFQTEIFFNSYIENSGADLYNLSYTYLAPMGIYAGQIDSLDKLEQGDKISIPNDPTNGGRALLLLQSAGLLTIDPEAGLTPTIKDILENHQDIQIVELDAPQVPATLDEVALGIINNGIAITSGFKPLEDSVYIESPETLGIENYYNIIAVQTARKDEAAILKVVEIYQSEAVRELIIEFSNNSRIPTF